jgi:transposase-like protein
VNAKKGISSLQLSRDIGVNKNTAWYLQKRIRKAMGEGGKILKGVVEVDETYVGGSLTNMAENRKKGFHRTGMEHMTPVLGMLQREGQVIVRVIDKAWGMEIKPILKKMIEKGSDLVTDGFGAYHGLDEHFDQHIILNHSRKVRRTGEYHTNTIEGFWSMFKRSLIGQFHQISPNHLQDYLNELSFKYNHRNLNSFNILMDRCLTTKPATC